MVYLKSMSCYINFYLNYRVVEMRKLILSESNQALFNMMDEDQRGMVKKDLKQCMDVLNLMYGRKNRFSILKPCTTDLSESEHALLCVSDDEVTNLVESLYKGRGNPGIGRSTVMDAVRNEKAQAHKHVLGRRLSMSAVGVASVAAADILVNHGELSANIITNQRLASLEKSLIDPSSQMSHEELMEFADLKWDQELNGALPETLVDLNVEQARDFLGMGNNAFRDMTDVSFAESFWDGAGQMFGSISSLVSDGVQFASDMVVSTGSAMSLEVLLSGLAVAAVTMAGTAAFADAEEHKLNMEAAGTPCHPNEICQCVGESPTMG